MNVLNIILPVIVLGNQQLIAVPEKVNTLQNAIDYKTFQERLLHFYEMHTSSAVSINLIHYFLNRDIEIKAEDDAHSQGDKAFQQWKEIVLKNENIRSIEDAYPLLDEAFSKGYSQAAFYKALCLWGGLGVRENQKEAMLLLGKESISNNKNALLLMNLSRRYTKNIDTELILKQLVDDDKHTTPVQSNNTMTSVKGCASDEYSEVIECYESRIKSISEHIRPTLLTSGNLLSHQMNDYVRAVVRYDWAQHMLIYWALNSAEEGNPISQWLLLQEDSIDHNINHVMVLISELPPYYFLPEDDKINSKSFNNINLALIAHYLLQAQKEEQLVIQTIEQAIKINSNIYDLCMFHRLLGQRLIRHHYGVKQGIWHFEQAVKENIIAMEQLAQIYYKGDIVPQDKSKAKELLLRAIARGSKWAERQYNDYFE